MLGDLTKRLVNGIVLLLGTLTFFLLPVGGKTTAQHMVAIFSTKPAREAATAFSTAARQVAREVARELEHARKSAAVPDSKAAPR